jgi:hypothetical protein
MPKLILPVILLSLAACGGEAPHAQPAPQVVAQTTPAYKPPPAPHWVLINPEHKGTADCVGSIEMDAASMSRHNDIVRAWMRVSYGPACDTHIREYMDLSDYDCTDNTWRQVQFNSTDWNGFTTNGLGDMVWYHAQPGRTRLHVLMYGCIALDNK